MRTWLATVRSGMVYCRVKLVVMLWDKADVVEDSPSPIEVVREAVALPRAAKDEPRENPPFVLPEVGAALDSAVGFW